MTKATKPRVIALNRNMGRFFVETVKLFDDPNAVRKTPRFKWIHSATSGTYKGHYQGDFTLDQAVFDKLIANFRADPKYQVGDVELPDGVIKAGIGRVAQFDYEHASEMAPWEGSIPTSGAPAVGWVIDLETRQLADGTIQLWALADLGEQIRGQIDAGQYESVSIAWNPEGVHWESGDPIGPVLTSIAFTNHPFLRGLESIAASARAFAAAGQSPGDGLQPNRSPEAHGGSSDPERDPMKDLRKRLTAVLRLAEAAEDDAVVDQVTELAASSMTLNDLLTALGVADGANAVQNITQLREAQTTLATLTAELNSLLAADVAADAEIAQSDVAAALSAKGWGAELTDPLLHARNAAVTEAIQKLSVGKPDGFKPSVGDYRAARALGRKTFLESYGVNQDPKTQHLTSTIVAGAGGAQFPAPGFQPQAPQALSGIPQPAPGTPQPLQLSDRSGAQGMDLSAWPGNNGLERVIAYLKANQPGFNEMPYDTRFSMARAFRKQHSVQ